MSTLTIFALCRIPIELAVFGFALRYYRRHRVSCSPPWALATALAGLFATTAGDLSGNWERACFGFGISHLCWFSFLVGRGRFSWPTAGVLAALLLPLEAAVVLPHVENDMPFVGYALCTILSVSAAVGARRSPGGKFYTAGLLTLMISDVCIGLSFADVRFAALAISPLYIASLVILLVALVRGIPAARPLADLAPAPIRQRRNAMAMSVIGVLTPAFFVMAMFFYNGNYCWYSHFISQSGLVFVDQVRPNHLSAWLLSTGLTVSALLCGWYFIERFRWGQGSVWQRWAIMLFGLIGAVGLAGIGAAPFDQHPDLHTFFTLCSVPFGIAIFLASLTPGDCFGRRGEKAIWLVFVGFVLACIAALSYLERLKQGGLPSDPIGRVIQKITVVGFYCYMLGQVVTYAVNTRDRVRDDKLGKSGS